jgi:hypothetical protein
MSEAVVSERALMGRINRVLAKSATPERLVRCRFGSRWFGDCGRYSAVNSNNYVTATHVDLGTWGREMGVLKSGETLAE